MQNRFACKVLALLLALGMVCLAAYGCGLTSERTEPAASPPPSLEQLLTDPPPAPEGAVAASESPEKPPSVVAAPIQTPEAADVSSPAPTPGPTEQQAGDDSALAVDASDSALRIFPLFPEFLMLQSMTTSHTSANRSSRVRQVRVITVRRTDWADAVLPGRFSVQSFCQPKNARTFPASRRQAGTRQNCPTAVGCITGATSSVFSSPVKMIFPRI